jgi:pimeloyl-ACP methyl ester carboxylesterase
MPFFVAPDGTRLHYSIEGSGPPLVLHLGAGADAELWREAGYVEPLSSSYSCILFDHRGHGKSDHPATPAANHIDRYADDVAALIAHLKQPSVSFFGWSNGFTVGLRVAQQHPQLFDALVLFGGIGRRATPEQIVEGTADRLRRMREKGWWFLLDEMVAAEKLPVPQWFLDRVAGTDVGPWFAYTESRPTWNWSPWDAMPLVNTPALLLAGELEDPDDVLAEVAAAMPNARRIRIPDREHINAFLYSEYVVPRVLEFLSASRKTAQPAG